MGRSEVRLFLLFLTAACGWMSCDRPKHPAMVDGPRDMPKAAPSGEVDVQQSTSSPPRKDTSMGSSVTGSPLSALAQKQRAGELPSFVARVSYYGPTAGRRLMSGGVMPLFKVELKIEAPADLAGSTLGLTSLQDLPEDHPLRAVGARYRLTLSKGVVEELAELAEGHTMFPGVGSVEVLGRADEYTSDTRGGGGMNPPAHLVPSAPSAQDAPASTPQHGSGTEGEP